MKNYVGQSDSAERPCIQEDVNHNLEWKPCPFSHMGWKYKRNGELHQSMNHSLRLDSLTQLPKAGMSVLSPDIGEHLVPSEQSIPDSRQLKKLKKSFDFQSSRKNYYFYRNKDPDLSAQFVKS